MFTQKQFCKQKQTFFYYCYTYTYTNSEGFLNQLCTVVDLFAGPKFLRDHVAAMHTLLERCKLSARMRTLCLGKVFSYASYRSDQIR